MARLAGSGWMDRACDIDHCEENAMHLVKIDRGAVTYTKRYCDTHARAVGAFDDLEADGP